MQEKNLKFAGLDPKLDENDYYNRIKLDWLFKKNLKLMLFLDTEIIYNLISKF